MRVRRHSFSREDSEAFSCIVLVTFSHSGLVAFGCNVLVVCSHNGLKASCQKF